MTTAHAYAASEASAAFTPFEYDLPELGPDDVEIDVIACGICHSDLSMLDNEWGMTAYPFVGGHEVTGTVAAVGERVPNLQPGDTVGLGWFSKSCMHCDQCMGGQHNRCVNEPEQTIVHRHGGFADKVRCHWGWATPLPEGLDAKKAGPLFCGGITAFTPFIQHGVNALSRVGVIGIGGLGHMALMFAKGFGADVTAFSTSADKEAEARRLGAGHFVNVKEDGALDALAGSFDLIINTTNVSLDWDAYVNTLAPGGVLHTVGAVIDGFGVGNSFPLILGQKSLAGSPLGSVATTRQMLDFCARQGLAPVTETYRMADVNDAFEKLKTGSPRYRLVLEN
ncbi:MAG: NAD(P)-dependent alcohol dehydrogenase [Planctomycetota bacterium]